MLCWLERGVQFTEQQFMHTLANGTQVPSLNNEFVDLNGEMLFTVEPLMNSSLDEVIQKFLLHVLEF